MKCSIGISNFLEEISSLSHSIVFLYFFALITDALYTLGNQKIHMTHFIAIFALLETKLQHLQDIPIHLHDLFIL